MSYDTDTELDQSGPIVATTSGGDFITAPEGIAQFVICDVYKKRPQADQNGILRDKVGVVVQVEYTQEPLRGRRISADDTPDERKHGRRYIVDLMFTLSMDERANLRKFIEAVQGRPFQPGEIPPPPGGYNLDLIIGMNGYGRIYHKTTRKGQVFANIYNPIPWDQSWGALIQPEGFVRKRDRQQRPQQPPQNASPQQPMTTFQPPQIQQPQPTAQTTAPAPSAAPPLQPSPPTPLPGPPNIEPPPQSEIDDDIPF